MPTSVWLLDTLQGSIMLSWCTYTYNREDYIGLSPTHETVWMVFTGTAMSICNVRTIITGVFQLFVLNKVSLINVKHVL